MTHDHARHAHPGAHVRSLLAAHGMTGDAFADSVGLSRAFVRDLVACRARINHDVAAVLAHAFGLRAHTWVLLQPAYDVERRRVMCSPHEGRRW